MDNYVIGLSGVAGAGKDLFCSMLIDSLAARGWKAKRFALADKLKADMAPFLSENLGVDIFNCTREDKESVRPLLVDYGAIQRERTEGKFWTSSLEEEIEGDEEEFDVAIVTDIRYDSYAEDEVFWLKVHLGGILAHISRYDTVDGVKKFVQPPNEHEMEQDPKLKYAADCCVEWETSGAENRQTLVDRFINFVEPVFLRS